MTPGMAIAVLGAVFVAPLIWAAIVALARRSAIGWGALEPLDDAHEKAVLALMVAPIVLGAILFLAPRETATLIAPPLVSFAELEGVARVAEPSVPLQNPFDWISFAGGVLLAIYVIGVLRFAIPLVWTHFKLRSWSASAQPHHHLPDVYISDAAATPLAVGRKRVLFPRALIEELSAEQIALVVDHERHHHVRGDVVFYAALAWLEALLWFNPFVRAQARHCRLAAELDCDRAVTAAAPQLKKAYAQTLLLVLRRSAGNALQCAPAVFSHGAVGEHRMRILQIMKSDTGGRKATPWLAYAVAIALTAPLAVAQLALAQSAKGAVASGLSLDAPTPTSTPISAPFDFDRSAFTHRPLDGRITGVFGARPDAFTGEMAFHAGVDIAAPFGAPVVAPADGRVIRVTTNTDYGNAVEIDHGDGFAMRYAHLSAFDVREGDSVRAGQIIGRVGNSGRSSSTHLHIEVWRSDRALDPRYVLDLPAE